MPDLDCLIPVVCDANAYRNGYSHTDGNSDVYAYSDTVRQRDNPKRWIRDRQLPTMGHSRPKCKPGGNQLASAQQNILWIRGRRTRWLLRRR